MLLIYPMQLFPAADKGGLAKTRNGDGPTRSKVTQQGGSAVFLEMVNMCRQSLISVSSQAWCLSLFQEAGTDHSDGCDDIFRQQQDLIQGLLTIGFP